MQLLNLNKKRFDLYTNEQKFKAIHRQTIIISALFITLICAFICFFAFFFRAKTRTYYEDLADSRIRNSAGEIEKNIDLGYKEGLQDVAYLGELLKVADLKTDGTLDYDKVNAFTASKSGNILKKFGVIYDNKIHMGNDTVLNYYCSLDEDKIYITDNTVYFISACDIEGIDGVVGSISLSSLESYFSTVIYENKATVLILDCYSNEIMVCSANYSDIFTGNITTDCNSWYTEKQLKNYNAFITSTGKNTLYLKGQWDIMLYKNETNIKTETGGLCFMLIVPYEQLTNQLANLTTISLTALYAVLTIFTILLILVYFAFAKTYLMNLKKTDYDNKTGLTNEGTFFRNAMALLLKNESEYGIISMNIKNFSRINSIYGTSTADELLVTIGDLLNDHFKSEDGDIAGYQHGDNYLLFLKGNKDEVLYKITELNELLRNYQNSGNITLNFTYGIKMTSPTSATELHNEFDCAKFAEKIGTAEDGIYFYDEEMYRRQEEADDFVNRFDSAIENHEFEVYFQLKWNLAKNDWGGCEALVRWNDPARGIVSPGKFIPLFEENGLITKLDKYIFEQVCFKLSQMLDNGERCVRVSVNLSKRNFADLSFIPEYEAIVEKYKIPHELIEFEITEGLIIDNMESYQEFINIIHNNKYSISMDDFGAGYSSLNLIHQLNFDVIKIDSKFFREGFDESNKTIVETVITLCHKLGKTVVAEGIEEPNEVEFLRSCGCDLIQGFYFAKPLPYEDFKKLLHSNEN